MAPSYAHPGALAAARSIQASLGAAGAPGPAEGTPNFSGDNEPDAFERLRDKNLKEEGRQRREFLAKMGKDTDSDVIDELRENKRGRDRARELEDGDEDEDDEEEVGRKGKTTYSDDEDDDERPLTGKLKKAYNFGLQQGLSKRALDAMDEKELLTWAHKQSKREARFNRVGTNKVREQKPASTASADGNQQQGDETIALPSKDLLKTAAKKLADARGWGEDDVAALESFGQTIFDAVQHVMEPRLRSATRDQEARDAEVLGEERARLEDRFPELSDDDVFDEVSTAARELLESGKARTLAQALRKAAVIELEDDDDYIERRVRSEVETRTTTQRRDGRPMIPRQLRDGPVRTESERTEYAMRGAFDKLFADGTRQEAARVFHKRAGRARK